MTREEILTELKALKAGQWTDKSADAIAAVLDHYLDYEIGIPGIELDEAERKYVETCECPPANQEEERMVYEAFKAGWMVRNGQTPKLPDNLNEAAWKYAPDLPSYIGGGISIAPKSNQDLRDAFTTGAEWMAKQGITIDEDIVLSECAYPESKTSLPEVKDLLKFIIHKCDLIINNENYTADEYVQDKVEDIAEMCHKVLDGQFGEIVPNPDATDAPFAIVTNTKTGKWFRVKKCSETMTRHVDLSVDVTFSVTPNDIKDTIPVIGTYRFADGMTKKELVGDNKELRIEIFNADKVKQDEYFLYNVWISGIDSETNEIILACDLVK